MPSAKDVFDYRRGFARVLDLPCNRQELTINPVVAGALYKKLITATEGYVGDVSIIHQAVAVKAAIDALDSAFQEYGDPTPLDRGGTVAIVYESPRERHQNYTAHRTRSHGAEQLPPA